MTWFACLRGFILCSLFCLSACGTGKPAPVIDGNATSAGVHTVAGGDTLWDIAKRYRVDMKDVVYVNNLTAPYFLAPGQRLALPPPLTYTVRPDDTLYDISRTFDISMTQLARQNNLKKPYRIRPGDTLRLPAERPEYVTNPKVQAAMPVRRQDGPPVKARPVEPVRKSLPVPARTPAMAGGDGKFGWPVTGPVISTYGPKRDGLHNDGVNIRAPRGAPVRSAENGVVVYAGNQLEGFGNLVLVRHEDRWMTAYAHLDKPLVRKGQTLRRGETLGTVGSSGNVSSPQLHFEIRRGTAAINPELYLARQGS